MTQTQRKEAVECHSRMICGLDYELPAWMQEAAARGFKFGNMNYADTVRAVRHVYPGDVSRIDALAKREKQARFGVFGRGVVRNHGPRRKRGVAGTETAALAR